MADSQLAQAFFSCPPLVFGRDVREDEAILDIPWGKDNQECPLAT
ncbi:hypothetical protein [Bradyrhizobium ottawaense]